MAIYERASVSVGAFSMEGKYYSSEEIFQLELERIFFNQWLCIGRSEQIANPGDYFLYNLGDESLIIVRDQDGVAHAHANVCTHRGARICQAEKGHFSSTIQCPYHAWTFDLNGSLRAARHMQDVPSFDKANYPLRSVQLVEWDGFLMIHMGEDPEPFEQAYAPLIGKWDKWRLADLKVGASIDYDIQANWKLLVENYSECYHCPLIHPALTALSPPDSGKNDLMEGPFLGGPMDLSSDVHSMTMGGGTTRPMISTLPPDEYNHVYYYSLFPNTLISLHPDYVMVHTMRPVSARRTLVHCEWLFEPETMARPDFETSDAVEFWDMTNREDWHACEISQQGVNSRFYRPGPYAQSEGLLWQFGQYYREILQAEQ